MIGSAPSGADARSTNSLADDRHWLGDKLLAEGKISREQLAEAIRTHAGRLAPAPFSETLELLQLVTAQRVAQLVAERAQLPYLVKVSADKRLARRVPQGRERAKLFVPFGEEHGIISIAVAAPEQYGIQHASLDFPDAREYRFYVTPRKEVIAALDVAWGEPIAVNDPAQFVERVLLEAIEVKASDVHFEPKEHTLQIRRRVDGVLSLQANVAQKDRAGIVQALKIRARIDIAESRLPQGGMFRLGIGARRYRFRVSTLPVLHGEKIQVRIADDNQTDRSFAELGMAEEHAAELRRILDTPHGAVLVTGPTGAGKSTLLFSAIAALALSELNVVSMEEPIEYEIPAINQVSVNPSIGLTFASVLREVLRQDPDVLVVGELRDVETASLAIRGSLTGHLLLGTLHTNDACGAITRLIEMGIEPFLVSGSVRAIIAQRLVKRLCVCKRVSAHSSELKKQYGMSWGEIHEPRGCEACRGTGYLGRVGIFEVMSLKGHGQQNDDRIRGIINAIKRKENASTESDLLACLRELGARTLREDGLAKVAAGITSLEEVLKETATF